MTIQTDTLSFEQAMGELEGLVRQLEEGKYSLEEAITSYEKGMALKSHCEAKLKAAKLKVDQITIGQKGSEGNDIEVVPFAL